ncbi:MAG TPA: DUF4105 domain-containing protein [Opitutaceae bacterium]|nr:DUF4105 domain-containing protein [Opitutaceae bacterium]
MSISRSRYVEVLICFLGVGVTIVAGGWVLGVIVFGVHSLALQIGLGVALVSSGVACARLTRGHRAWKRWLVGAGAILLWASVLGGSVRPKNSRAWVAEAEKTPWAEISGDVVTLHHYRIFDWTDSGEVGESRWLTRSFRLSELRHVDFFMVYWGSPHICHTMVSFDFGPDGRVCASVEARREVGESYSPWAGMFRGYELYYVLGDEQDVVRLRTEVQPDNHVYLFRLPATPEAARIQFLDYVRSINELRHEPAWYHSVVTNCTTVIRQHVKPLGLKNPWSWRILLNGHLDTYLYERGYLDRSLSLPELKQRSLLQKLPESVPLTSFSDEIRRGLPGFELAHHSR